MKKTDRRTHWREFTPRTSCTIEGWGGILEAAIFGTAITPDEPPQRIEVEFAWASDDELKRRVRQFAATVPDYDLLVHGSHWVVSPPMEAYFRSSKTGPRLAYYLSKHPGLYREVYGTSQTWAVLAKLLSLDRQLGVYCSMSPADLYAIEFDPAPSCADILTATRLHSLFSWDQQSERAS